MMLTQNIGGQMNMYSRYYVKGGRVYMRYNRIFTQKPIKALRQEEINEAIFKQRVLSLVTAVILFCMICISANTFKYFSKIGYQSTNKSSEIVVINDTNKHHEIANTGSVSNVSIAGEYIQFKNRSEEKAIGNDMEKVVNDDFIVEDTTKDVQVISDLVYTKSVEEIIEVDGIKLQKMGLPDQYYPNIDYSSFQPMESYQTITDTGSEAYAISYHDNAYTDENGLRRYKPSQYQFSINGQDDYIVAMGTYYKTKGSAGERFLIKTTTGMFTVITGDEKADKDTDSMNMFTTHNGKAGIIEFIIDRDNINSDMYAAGTPVNGSDPILSGKIVGIYKIL